MFYHRRRDERQTKRQEAGKCEDEQKTNVNASLKCSKGLAEGCVRLTRVDLVGEAVAMGLPEPLRRQLDQ